MTALDTLLGNATQTVSLVVPTWASYTLYDSCDEEGKTTLLTSTVSTILNNIEMPNNVRMVRDTYSLVESMTDEELAHASELLDTKGLEIYFGEATPDKDSNKTLIKTQQQ